MRMPEKWWIHDQNLPLVFYSLKQEPFRDQEILTVEDFLREVGNPARNKSVQYVFRLEDSPTFFDSKLYRDGMLYLVANRSDLQRGAQSYRNRISSCFDVGVLVFVVARGNSRMHHQRCADKHWHS